MSSAGGHVSSDDGASSGSATSGGGAAPNTSSGGTSGSFSPAGVVFSELSHPDEGVNVLTASLVDGEDGLQLYAVLINVSDTGACSGAMSVELYDAFQQSLGDFNGGIFGAQIYRINDLDQAVACVDPQELGMAAVVDIDTSIELHQVAYVVYRFTYFASEFFTGGLRALPGFRIADLKRHADRPEEYSLSGRLENGTDATVEDVSVTLLSLNEAGRPLGMVTIQRALPLAAGEDWPFESEAQPASAPKALAFPVGTFSF